MEVAAPLPAEFSLSIKAYVELERSDEGRQQALNTVLLTIHSKQIPLKDVVVSLGEYLTSTQDELRSRGTLLLSEIITRLPQLPLTSSSIQTLVTFYSDRLKDKPCLKEVAKGLLAVVKHHGKQIPRGLPAKICERIFTDVEVQAQVQSIRKAMFDTLSHLMMDHETELVSLNDQLARGVIAAIDRERDPRNLLVCFALAKFVLTKLPTPVVQPVAEELFDVTSCYFPITFTPPKDDPHGITPEDLRYALRQVMCCHPLLAPMTFAMIIDKIESSAPEVKVDGLQTIAHAIKTFSLPSLEPHVKNLYIALKKEILHTGDASVTSEAQRTLQTLVAVTCPDQVAGFHVGYAGSAGPLLELVLSDCVGELKVPDSKLSRMHANMMAKAAAGSCNAFRHIMAAAWPALKDKFEAHSTLPSQRLALLEVVQQLVTAASEAFESAGRPPLHPLAGYVAGLFELYQSATVGGYPEQRTAAVSGAARLLSALRVLVAAAAAAAAATASATDASAAAAAHSAAPTEGQVHLLVDTAASLFWNDDDGNVRRASQEALASSAASHPIACTRILSNILPRLFASPPFTAAAVPGRSSTLSLDSALSLVRDLALAAPTQLVPSVTPPLIKIVQQDLPAAVNGEASALSRVKSSLEALAAIVKGGGSADCLGDLHISLLSALVSAAATATTCTTTSASLLVPRLLPSGLVETSAAIVTAITRHLPVREQTQLVIGTVRLFKESDLTGLRGLSPAEVSAIGSTFKPLEPRVCPTALAQAQLIPVFAAVLGNARPEVAASLPATALTSALLGYVSALPDASALLMGPHALGMLSEARAVLDTAITHVAMALGAFLNKLPAGGALDSLLGSILDQLVACAGNSAANLGLRGRAITGLIWVSKGLALRSHSWTPKVSAELCRLLLTMGDESLCIRLAEGYDSILADNEMMFNKLAHATAGPGALYKQKWLTLSLPTLLDAFTRLSSSASSPSPSSSSSSTSFETAASDSSLYGRIFAAMSEAHRSITRTALQLAVVAMLRHMPRAVLLAHVQNTLPLLIDALSSDASQLRVVALYTLFKLMQESVELVAPHVNTLSRALVEMTQYRPAVRVRLAALHCLDALTTLPYHRVHPYRLDIIHGLEAALDDPKRAVRRQAVKTRNEWFVFSAPKA